MKKTSPLLIIIFFCSIQLPAHAATVLNDSWSNVVNGRCSDQNAAWWSSTEAFRIVENVVYKTIIAENYAARDLKLDSYHPAQKSRFTANYGLQKRLPLGQQINGTSNGATHCRALLQFRWK